MPVEPIEGQDELPEIQQKMKILEAIKRGQEPLWDDPLRGLIRDPALDESLDSMQAESIRQDAPLSRIIDDSYYNLETLRRALVTLVYEVIELGMDAGFDSMSLLKQLDGLMPELVNNVLKGNSEYLADLAERLGVSPIVLSFIVGSLLQPSMISLASNSKREYLDAWELTICPVCGRLPSLVLKSGEEVWRFRCSYCWAEYKMDIFSCPNCGSAGSENKEFLLVGESQESEVASCSECNRYYKIVNKAKLQKQIPDGLWDLKTELLDEIAHERGLKRLDDVTPEG
jgi:formate dehydrogenase maturation protein FdhE